MAYIPLQGVVHSLAVASDDGTEPKMILKFPEMRLSCGDRYLANSVFPDGAVTRDRDTSYLMIREGAETLYALAVYHKNPSGAGGLALILLGWQPVFEIFKPMLDITLEHYAKNSDKQRVMTLYNALNAHDFSRPGWLCLWGQFFPLVLPTVLYEDEFFGASLTNLVQAIGLEVMLIWHAMLTQRTIVVLGSDSHQAGCFVLASPLLVAPLRGFSSGLVPSVNFNNIAQEVLQSKGLRIAGVAHPLVREHPEWYEFLVDLPNRRVQHSTGQTVQGNDREFIHSVLQGIQEGKDEIWVRQKFWDFTVTMLDGVQATGVPVSPEHQQSLSGISKTNGFQRYLKEKVSHRLAPRPIERPVLPTPGVAPGPVAQPQQRSQPVAPLPAALPSTKFQTPDAPVPPQATPTTAAIEAPMMTPVHAPRPSEHPAARGYTDGLMGDFNATPSARTEVTSVNVTPALQAHGMSQSLVVEPSPWTGRNDLDDTVVSHSDIISIPDAEKKARGLESPVSSSPFIGGGNVETLETPKQPSSTPLPTPAAVLEQTTVNALSTPMDLDIGLDVALPVSSSSPPLTPPHPRNQPLHVLPASLEATPTHVQSPLPPRNVPGSIFSSAPSGFPQSLPSNLAAPVPAPAPAPVTTAQPNVSVDTAATIAAGALPPLPQLEQQTPLPQLEQQTPLPQLGQQARRQMVQSADALHQVPPPPPPLYSGPPPPPPPKEPSVNARDTIGQQQMLQEQMQQQMQRQQIPPQPFQVPPGPAPPPLLALVPAPAAQAPAAPAPAAPAPAAPAPAPWSHVQPTTPAPAPNVLPSKPVTTHGDIMGAGSYAALSPQHPAPTPTPAPAPVPAVSAWTFASTGSAPQSVADATRHVSVPSTARSEDDRNAWPWVAYATNSTAAQLTTRSILTLGTQAQAPVPPPVSSPSPVVKASIAAPPPTEVMDPRAPTPTWSNLQYPNTATSAVVNPNPQTPPAVTPLPTQRMSTEPTELTERRLSNILPQDAPALTPQEPMPWNQVRTASLAPPTSTANETAPNTVPNVSSSPPAVPTQVPVYSPGAPMQGPHETPRREGSAAQSMPTLQDPLRSDRALLVGESALPKQLTGPVDGLTDGFQWPPASTGGGGRPLPPIGSTVSISPPRKQQTSVDSVAATPFTPGPLFRPYDPHHPWFSPPSKAPLTPPAAETPPAPQLPATVSALSEESVATPAPVTYPSAPSGLPSVEAPHASAGNVQNAGEHAQITPRSQDPRTESFHPTPVPAVRTNVGPSQNGGNVDPIVGSKPDGALTDRTQPFNRNDSPEKYPSFVPFIGTAPTPPAPKQIIQTSSPATVPEISAANTTAATRAPLPSVATGSPVPVLPSQSPSMPLQASDDASYVPLGSFTPTKDQSNERSSREGTQEWDKTQEWERNSDGWLTPIRSDVASQDQPKESPRQVAPVFANTSQAVSHGVQPPMAPPMSQHSPVVNSPAVAASLVPKQSSPVVLQSVRGANGAPMYPTVARPNLAYQVGYAVNPNYNRQLVSTSPQRLQNRQSSPHRSSRQIQGLPTPSMRSLQPGMQNVSPGRVRPPVAVPVAAQPQKRLSPREQPQQRLSPREQPQQRLSPREQPQQRTPPPEQPQQRLSPREQPQQRTPPPEQPRVEKKPLMRRLPFDPSPRSERTETEERRSPIGANAEQRQWVDAYSELVNDSTTARTEAVGSVSRRGERDREYQSRHNVGEQSMLRSPTYSRTKGSLRGSQRGSQRETHRETQRKSLRGSQRGSEWNSPQDYERSREPINVMVSARSQSMRRDTDRVDRSSMRNSNVGNNNGGSAAHRRQPRDVDYAAEYAMLSEPVAPARGRFFEDQEYERDRVYSQYNSLLD